MGSGNGEKNEKYKCRKYNGNKNQGNEKSSRNVTGAAGRNPKATISAYENDHIDIKSSIVLEIAKALNCSGSYLLEGKKAEVLDVRIMDALLELKNDQMREVALKQIQALALLG